MTFEGGGLWEVFSSSSRGVGGRDQSLLQWKLAESDFWTLWWLWLEQVEQVDRGNELVDEGGGQSVCSEWMWSHQPMSMINGWSRPDVPLYIVIDSTSMSERTPLQSLHLHRSNNHILQRSLSSKLPNPTFQSTSVLQSNSFATKTRSWSGLDRFAFERTSLVRKVKKMMDVLEVVVAQLRMRLRPLSIVFESIVCRIHYESNMRQ